MTETPRPSEQVLTPEPPKPAAPAPSASAVQDSEASSAPAPEAPPPDAAALDILPDAPAAHWSAKAPAWAQPYLRLSRLDRPVGWQLLYLPCLMGLGLTASEDGFWSYHVLYAALFLVGAIAMRGAGCTYNDIVDRKIDAQVERTRARPLPSGQISLNQAWAWLGIQCVIGFIVLLLLPRAAQLTSLAAIPLVAAYPFMKRITWWPQAWLGLCFSWGALVAGAATDGLVKFETFLLFAGCVLWVIAYDTIYALQDREDDALVGVRSTARLFGKNWRPWIAVFYVSSVFMWGLAAMAAGAGGIAIFALAALAALVIGPLIDKIDAADPATALAAFQRNVMIGLLAAGAFALSPAWVTIAPIIRKMLGGTPV